MQERKNYEVLYSIKAEAFREKLLFKKALISKTVLSPTEIIIFTILSTFVLPQTPILPQLVNYCKRSNFITQIHQFIHFSYYVVFLKGRQTILLFTVYVLRFFVLFLYFWHLNVYYCDNEKSEFRLKFPKRRCCKSASFFSF